MDPKVRHGAMPVRFLVPHKRPSTQCRQLRRQKKRTFDAVMRCYRCFADEGGLLNQTFFFWGVHAGMPLTLNMV